jgi:hypothetical protein
MNALNQLAAELRRAYPNATIDDSTVGEDEPLLGVWWLEFSPGPSTRTGFDPGMVEVEWSASAGFGLTMNREVLYGERSDEAHASVESVLARIMELADSGEPTRMTNHEHRTGHGD